MHKVREGDQQKASEYETNRVMLKVTFKSVFEKTNSEAEKKRQ